MKKIAAATLIALILTVMNNIASAQAFTDGWNFIRVFNCLGVQSGGVDTLTIFPTTGGQLVTSDATTIVAIAPFCASGDGFFIFLNGGVWNGVSVYPSIK